MYYKEVSLLHKCVEDFLEECGKLIDNRRIDLFLNDPDNRSTMHLLGYNPKAIMQEIKDLKSSDLHEGPKEDKDKKHGGQVWIFKKTVCSIRLYIKLKIRIRDGKEVFLMSFHPDK